MNFYVLTVKGKQLYSLAGRITGINVSSVTVSVATGIYNSYNDTWTANRITVGAIVADK